MKKAQRFLALAGMGVAAGAMIGMGPAQAAPSRDQATPTASYFDDNVVGYYRTEWSCERAGYTGRQNGAWYRYDCDPIRYGWRGWVFRLIVDDNDWAWDDWRGSWPGGWPYRPDYAGRPFHPHGGHGRPNDFPDRGGPRGFPDRGGPRGLPDRDGPPRGGQGGPNWPRP